MVSLLQQPSEIPLSPPESLEGEHRDDLMQTRRATGSPPPQSENPGFSCPPYPGDVQPEPDASLSSHSPSPSSPCPEQLQTHFPAGPGQTTFRLSQTEKYPGFGYEDGPVAGSPGRFLKGSRVPFHPYKRQFNEDVFLEAHPALSLDSHSFKSPGCMETFEDVASAGDTEPFAPNFSAEAAAWCNGPHYPSQEHSPQMMHGSEVKLKPPPMEGPPGLYCYQPQHMYCPSQPFHQYSPGNGNYPMTYVPSPHYAYQRIAPQASVESQQPLFPKPIYSYSILIFMALKNSKTGSLPVSEIYNFMTEHFPYFKTAPDGWKNSVRHNLSLNKCFEKVENKSGSSSRKGCLWALNPAKIDKMQEELQKWKRKDPIAVRKSMAKPEELDTLIGDKSEKLRSPLMPCPPQGLTSSDGHGELRVQPGTPQDSPLPAHTPPNHGMKILSEPSPARTMQDTLMPEGDLSTDIDTINPSFTDFDFQGSLWEELKDDGLALDPLVLVTSSPVPSHCLPSHCLAGSGGSTGELGLQGNGAPSGLSDLHLTTFYSALMDLDPVAPGYLNSSSKPMGLV
ncbi:forkhead box protein N1 isoform X2 [Notamacropus eugenii]|uniref:forkhead box protein N1 isoform X2 n=1 Tax=Notamacropus eugenii TaxID=9315 RepID=UPI003B683C41